MLRRAALIAALAVALPAINAEASCVNKYVSTQQGVKVSLTLLTGKLTFQEAKDLAKAINDKKAPQLEWLDAKGTVVARSSSVDAVRPMPVGCDGKSSGSVLSVVFLRNAPPAGPLTLRLAADNVVTFEQQKS
jgi:hypothetical protein